MSFPKINRPIFSVTIPSTKASYRFQMMSRRDEKALLVAKSSNDPLDWVISIRQVVQNCAVDAGFKVDSLASFDLEFIFVKLRQMSMSPIERLTYKDEEDSKDYTIEVNLENVEVVFPEGANPMVDAGSNAKIQLKWPGAMAWADEAVMKASNAEDALDEIVALCVDKIWVGSLVHDAQNVSREDIKEFLQSLEIQTWTGIRDYISKTPHLSYWIEWTNSHDTKRRFELKTLADFFPF